VLERLNENLKMLRNMRERLSAMLARVKADPELQDSSELIHVTGELTKSLGAEIQALERAIAEIGKSQARRGPEGNPEGPERT
jgi:hypothetical protein